MSRVATGSRDSNSRVFKGSQGSNSRVLFAKVTQNTANFAATKKFGPGGGGAIGAFLPERPKKSLAFLRSMTSNGDQHALGRKPYTRSAAILGEFRKTGA